jgi:hypothetical protein
MDKINGLITQYGLGIVTAPTKEEVERFKRAYDKENARWHPEEDDLGTFGTLLEYMGNGPCSLQSLVRRRTYTPKAALRDKLHFIKGLERGLQFREDPRATKQDLRKMLALARGDWTDLNVLQKMIDFWKEIRERE